MRFFNTIFLSSEVPATQERLSRSGPSHDCPVCGGYKHHPGYFEMTEMLARIVCAMRWWNMFVNLKIIIAKCPIVRLVRVNEKKVQNGGRYYISNPSLFTTSHCAPKFRPAALINSVSTGQAFVFRHFQHLCAS